MGCATSKLDDSPAVALCRERCALLDQAQGRRFAFAQAHAAYLLSLKSVGLSLHRFFTHRPDHPPTTSSPTLNLPIRRKGDDSPPPDHHLHSHSPAMSKHDAASDSESSFHRHNAQRDRPHSGYTPDYGNLNFNISGAKGDVAGSAFMNMSYMKNQTTPSLVHTQRPPTPETIYTGELSASSSSYNPYPNSAHDNNRTQNQPSYPNQNLNNYDSEYLNYDAGGGFGGDSSSLAPYSGGSPSSPVLPSASKVPPPPPPRSSTWDFLNPFDTVESYYPSHTPNHDTKEIREAEGIPDLEDEDGEVVKEIHGDQRFIGSGTSGIHLKPVAREDVRVAKHKSRPGVGIESDPVEYEVHMVSKNAQERIKDGGNVSEFKARSRFKSELEVVKQIQVQFERASDSGNELAKFLEVGKRPYDGKHRSNQVSSKLLHLPVALSFPSLSKGTGNADPSLLEIDEDAQLMASINLSSTLHKLHLWEKKLYEEVKVEEKMRVLYEGKSSKLKYLDERGAEAPKVDATRNLVRSLSTKIKIAMQVVDKISVKINNLRDEELWPQLHELIQGLTRMWKSMLECHHNQCQAIGKVRQLDDSTCRKHFGDAHFEATRELEHDLINWTLGFSCWIAAQKDYVQALNNWLMKCLLYIPEETPDGLAPFSPGRIGAPPVFVVCNQWSKSLDTISEKEVIDSMWDFASNVLLLWDQEKAEMRQKMLANKDETKFKNLEKEDQKIQKQIQALNKKMILISAVNNGMLLTGSAVYPKETTEGGNLQASLRHVLEALERYATSSLKVYEDLLQHIEEDHLAHEHEKVY